MNDQPTFTAFRGPDRVGSGPLEAVASTLATLGDIHPLQIFDDATGQVIELDLRNGADRAVTDYRARTSRVDAPAARQGRGRPRLGVVAREVTLLPRHWDWLSTQPGGASATLRRLVEDARRASPDPDRARQAVEAAYRVMSALAGDLPQFEEASRALFAGDAQRLVDLAAQWPADIRDYVLRLASAA